jgi:hypothetical protein
MVCKMVSVAIPKLSIKERPFEEMNRPIMNNRGGRTSKASLGGMPAVFVKKPVRPSPASTRRKLRMITRRIVRLPEAK